jgi:GTPase SAR1 family protein
VKVGRRAIRLQLWDRPRESHALIPSYLRNAAVAVLAYDFTSRETFDQLIGQADRAFFVVGKTIDLGDHWEYPGSAPRRGRNVTAQTFLRRAQTTVNIAHFSLSICAPAPASRRLAAVAAEILNN